MTQSPVDPGAGYVILGAAGGIGSCLARKLSRSGARLMLAGRPSDRLTALSEELNASRYELDATRPAEVEACFTQTKEMWGRINGAANCVGSILLKPAHLTSEEEWAQVMAINLTSAFAVVRSAAKTMLQTGGSIVLVSSVAGRLGLTNHEAIAAAKAGIQGLALSAAATYAPRAIRVNVVAPGLTRTPLTTRLTENEASLKASMAMHPLGRIGEPEDIASAIEWFLNPAQGWVTGQILGIDGGLGSVRAR